MADNYDKIPGDIIDGYRYFTAKSGLQVRDQLTKAIMDNCYDKDSKAFKRMLVALGASLSERHQKNKFKIGGRIAQPCPMRFLSSIAIHDKECVALIFTDLKDLWIYTKPEYRNKGIMKQLWNHHLQFNPYTCRREGYRPFTAFHPKGKYTAADSFFASRMQGTIPTKE